MFEPNIDDKMSRILVFSGSLLALVTAFTFPRDLFFVHAWSTEIQFVVYLSVTILGLVILAGVLSPSSRGISIVAALTLLSLPLFKLLLLVSTIVALQPVYDNISIAVVISFALAIGVALTGLMRNCWRAISKEIILAFVLVPLAVQYSMYMKLVS